MLVIQARFRFSSAILGHKVSVPDVTALEKLLFLHHVTVRKPVAEMKGFELTDWISNPIDVNSAGPLLPSRCLQSAVKPAGHSLNLRSSMRRALTPRHPDAFIACIILRHMKSLVRNTNSKHK